MSDPDIDDAISSMKQAAVSLETDRARLSSAMWGIYHTAGFKGLMAVVGTELRRIAQRLGPAGTGGWVG